MKRVVSVSLGSDRRDHCVETEFCGIEFRIERIGTNGDLEKAVELVRSLDGKVDAFGMGGIDLYIQAGRKRYMLKDARRIAEAARTTPIVDGSGLKNTLERKAVLYLEQSGQIDFKGKKVLLVCGVDRFGMAEALVQTGAEVVFGDLVFSLGIPVLLRSLRTLAAAASILGPVVSRLPFKYLYPTGERQEKITSKEKYRKYYDASEIIAGDFHYIKRYLPEKIEGKIIITNTVTREDVELLAGRGARLLITTTPELQGRSFGTNVMEAVLVVLADKPPAEIKSDDYNEILEKVNFAPRIVDLQQ
ncbi:MAG: quinate 5-dehydrogenase [Peptococcaceae bacterium]|jgi:hypothetical protein|nr:quinate 5-dehydrogenase [Peptococcaceae bacterium]MDH7523691.1 quinate 5-dehydrogenase [Peptococcaceae bacterium]